MLTRLFQKMGKKFEGKAISVKQLPTTCIQSKSKPWSMNRFEMTAVMGRTWKHISRKSALKSRNTLFE